MLTSRVSRLSFLIILAFSLFAATGYVTAQILSSPARVPGGGYKIAGIVVSRADGHPLGRARVTVQDVKDQKNFQSLITAEDGKFEFSGLPAAKYSLTGAKRGFMAASYDQHDQFSTAIVTGAGLDTESLVLKLAPDAVITGKVLDEAGEPVRHAFVNLYYLDHQSGVDQIHRFRNANTNDLGVYEFTPLRPGTYFISANAKPWYAVHRHSEQSNSPSSDRSGSIDPSLDVAYPLTYYADATDAESATPIPIRGGERLQVDIHLNPVPALHVLFRVPGDNQHGFVFPRLEQAAFDDPAAIVETSGGQMISPGVLEMTGIPAGRYNVRVTGPSSSEMNGIDLTKDGEEIDTSHAEPLSSVKLSVKMPGGIKPSMHLGIGMRSGNRTMAGWQRLDSRGEAEFQQISPGHYEVVVWAPDRRYSIAHITAEGATVASRRLTLAAGSSVSVSLSLAEGTVELQGTAKLAGKAFAGVMVVLVPKDPEGNHDLFRRDQSDLDGTFVLHDVIPGSYIVLAIENGWDLDWSQPAVIAAYAKHGRTIEVRDERGHTMTLTDAVEVQSK